MLFKNIIEKLNLAGDKNVGHDMKTAKHVNKHNVQANAPAIIAHKIQAGGDITLNAAPAQKTDHQLAREVINELERRRVLTDPHEWEKVQDCIHSVFDIRSQLAGFIDATQQNGALEVALKQIQAACNEFLTATQRAENQSGFISGMDMRQTLDDFRRTVAPHIKSVADQHGITVTGALLAMLSERS